MESYTYLWDLAVILLSTKLFGLLTKKFNMPQVVGALLAGVILGPAVLGAMSETAFIKEVAEIGVIVLMFCAGMETDINEMKRSGKASLLIAVAGVLVPLIGGFAVAYFFNKPGMISSDADATVFLQNIFIGIILTATSVSITVETLKEMGKLKTASGNAILGAAIIDDILGIVALTIVTSMADPSVKIGIVLLKIIAFAAVVVVAGYLFYKFYILWFEKSGKGMHRHSIVVFVFCILMSYIAEEYFGVADITGAFFAGLVISCTHKEKYVASKFDTLSYLLLSPVFFASIGLKVVLPEMNMTLVIFAVLLTLVAVATKVIGCGLGSLICKYNTKDSLRIGVGMVSRGEVALIVAGKGTAVGLLGSNFLGPVVIVVLITTILTPVLLKLVYKDAVSEKTQEEGFAGGFEKKDEYRQG